MTFSEPCHRGHRAAQTVGQQTCNALVTLVTSVSVAMQKVSASENLTLRKIFFKSWGSALFVACTYSIFGMTKTTTTTTKI